MYQQNKSLHKINLWFILQYVKQNMISNMILFKSASNIIFYNNVQMYVILAYFTF